MPKDMILEIGCEEIPSAYVADIILQMKENAESLFEKNRIGYEDINTYATPRRLVLYVKGVMEIQAVSEKKIYGPPKRRAYDSSNTPTQASLGFAKKHGVSINELKVEASKKGEYVYVLQQEGGEQSHKILEDALPSYISSLSFPKVMRWGAGTTKFVRPVHWILAMLGDRIVKFSYGGCTSSYSSQGHRFLSPEAFDVASPDEYLKIISKKFVLIDQNDRVSTIERQINSLAATVGGKIIEDPGLLETVCYMTEYPSAIIGRFDERYLELPKELLITVMKVHQRYFSVGTNQGDLLPYFITISNMKTDKEGIIRSGNERVLSARLSDAYFFYTEDKKIPFRDYSARLNNVLFQEKLGTLKEKIERVAALSVFLSQKMAPEHTEAVKNAALLSKSDLTTHMVYEFPSLQGIMGREYARQWGEDEEVYNAIFEHYLPRYADDILPSSLTGAIVGIADRIDTITGCFGIDLIPTGSQDPHGIRRQALAVIAISISLNLNFDLPLLLDAAIRQLGRKIERSALEVKREVLEFFNFRLKVKLEGDGFPYDIVDAVLAGDYAPFTVIKKKVSSLCSIRKTPEFSDCVSAYRRVSNILSSFKDVSKVDTNLFTTDYERALHGSFIAVKERVDQYIAKEDFEAAVMKLSSIKDDIDRLFDNVMVMDKKEEIKTNRLSLLHGIAMLFLQAADFSKLQGER